jgi:hypothetical protein
MRKMRMHEVVSVVHASVLVRNLLHVCTNIGEYIKVSKKNP